MANSEENNRAIASPGFWDARYLANDSEDPTHEWFRSYKDLQPFFAKHLFQVYGPAQKPKILHLGAGDSTIPRDLLDYGYQNQLCIDFSQILVQRMQSRHQEGLTWMWADVRDMPVIETGSVDVAFDKGTLDAMIYGSPWDPPDEVKDNSGRYIREVARTLKDSGVFLYITYRQPHFIRPLLNQDDLWDLQMETLSAGENSFEYYAFVLKKAQKVG